MSKHTRTPLAQGILSDTSQTSFHRSYESPLTARNDFSPLLSSKHDNDDDDDNEQGTPRQNTPTKSKPSNRPKTVTELSLSDVDGDFLLRDSRNNSKRRLPVVKTAVLVVETEKSDALSESGEVETRSFTIQSPAKVVCHSPGRDGKVEFRKSRNKKLSESLPSEDVKKPSIASKDTSMDSFTKTKVGSGPLKEVKNNSASLHSSGGVVKKKKKFVPVQSRYKQQPAKKEDVKSRSLEISAISPHPSVQPSSAGQRKASRVTSTPFLMTSMYEGNHATDGSILDQTRFQTNEPAIKEPMLKKTKAKHFKDSLKKRDKNKEGAKDGKSGNEVDQLTLDLHYARLLQITYLKMKARQTFENQEEKAKSDIYGLWMMNRKLEKEIEALNLAIKTQKLEIAIDQLLNIQLEGFKPLSGKLSKFIMKSSRLAEAITNTNHYLPLTDIKMQNEEKLFVALDESKRLLAEIRSLTRRNQPEIEQLSAATEVLMKTVNSEVQEQKKCSELLAACATLTNQERSLQVQILQDG